MIKVSLPAFLAGVDAIRAASPAYRLGMDGSSGYCDCIGMIIGAIRRAGGEWDGTHGSNYAARNEMAYLLPVTDAEDLSVGEVVYKAAMPGQTSYNLPSRYSGDPDKRDYYHVGVVRGVKPLEIVHCTSPGGITIDTKLGKWTHRGWLEKVAAEGESAMDEIMNATVVAEAGESVNMRSKPNGALVERVPVGAVVTVSGQQDGWSRIAYNGKSGWMMSQFLVGDGDQGQSVADAVNISLPRDIAEKLRDILSDALGWG